MKTVRSGLKAMFRAPLRAAGYEIHRKDALGRTMATALAQVRRLGFSPGTVIDIGVGTGTPELYRAYPRAQYLLVEPLREFEPQLAKLAKKLNAQYVVAAAGERAGSTTIRIREDPTNSSILREVDRSDEQAAARTVEVVTVDSLCEEGHLPDPFLIKVDVQGGELGVLKGARQVLSKTELVLLETSLFPFYEDGPQLFDLQAWMKAAGFVVYDIFGGHCRPYDGALAQIDVAFVRENGQFRRHQGYR